MKKKIISIILTSAMVFSALCGCGSNQDQSTADGNAAGQASSDDKIVLSVSVMANEEEKKISLSIKALLPDEDETEEVQEDVASEE